MPIDRTLTKGKSVTHVRIWDFGCDKKKLKIYVSQYAKFGIFDGFFPI